MALRTLIWSPASLGQVLACPVRTMRFTYMLSLTAHRKRH
jgi:hypothetical protein